MNAQNTPVVVHILDKEYRIACQKGEEDGLLASARLLDTKMRSIRSSGKVIGSDRMAVMVALNLAHELLQQKNNNTTTVGTISKRVQSMQEKIDIALKNSNQLEV
ncbi:MAG: cell division protein ZapA [Chromatiaceae bacterium]|nr:cell division protein ZapA [Gammaproteobacteria bacterium]MCB1872254.1 cell division protein ZapA [Gammaproteobacteria bacterium]MCB1880007.1 cell division protein ZapA [Gammaproteobacteria bacterium]MCP5427069.1 cell division protein ZapA [Chromatiaceae bacterium]MCP5446864.1 cell division protein ZapA [Chromatiaceae bacterium]